MSFRLSIHQHAALAWLTAAPVVFAPVLQQSPLENAGMLVAQGVALVTAIIALVPLLLRWPLFRRWFCWTDAFSDAQRKALVLRSLRRYYRVAFEDGYAQRITPYLLRVFLVTVAMSIAQEALRPSLPPRTSSFDLPAALMWASWYPITVVILILASCPWARMLRAKKTGRS